MERPALETLRAAGVQAPAADLSRLASWRAGGRLPAPREGARLVLGRHRGRLLYAEERHALVAFGPPQSGKSAGLAVPALLEWTGPAVASSIKTDLLDVTLARRRALGQAFVFDPFGLSGLPSHTWSPLRAARTWADAIVLELEGVKQIGTWADLRRNRRKRAIA